MRTELHGQGHGGKSVKGEQGLGGAQRSRQGKVPLRDACVYWEPVERSEGSHAVREAREVDGFGSLL